VYVLENPTDSFNTILTRTPAIAVAGVVDIEGKSNGEHNHSFVINAVCLTVHL